MQRGNGPFPLGEIWVRLNERFCSCLTKITTKIVILFVLRDGQRGRLPAPVITLRLHLIITLTLT